MVLEILYGLFVLFCGLERIKSAQVAATFGFGIDFPGVDAILA